MRPSSLINSGISSGKTSNFESDNSIASPGKRAQRGSIKGSDRANVLKFKDWERKNTNKTTNTGGTTSNNSYQSDHDSPIRVNVFRD